MNFEKALFFICNSQVEHRILHSETCILQFAFHRSHHSLRSLADIPEFQAAKFNEKYFAAVNAGLPFFPFQINSCNRIWNPATFFTLSLAIRSIIFGALKEIPDAKRGQGIPTLHDQRVEKFNLIGQISISRLACER